MLWASVRKVIIASFHMVAASKVQSPPLSVKEWPKAIMALCKVALVGEVLGHSQITQEVEGILVAVQGSATLAQIAKSSQTVHSSIRINNSNLVVNSHSPDFLKLAIMVDFKRLLSNLVPSLGDNSVSRREELSISDEEKHVKL